MLTSGSGIDIALVLDGSLSMLARDVRPSRLEQMKQEVRRLVALSESDRIGLLAFAGRSYILTPITVDAGALGLFVNEFDVSVVGQRGTSLSLPLRQATSLLGASRGSGDKAIVVMTDGEAHEPVDEIEAAARGVRDAGISLVLVGFGTTTGATIPEPDQRGQHRDLSGQIVVTRYRPDVLGAAAAAGGGTFVPAEATDKAARIRVALSTLRTAKRVAQAGQNRKARFQLFLAPAILIFIADTLLRERRLRRRNVPAAAVTATE